jgi:putative peptidoglycan binding protein
LQQTDVPDVECLERFMNRYEFFAFCVIAGNIHSAAGQTAVPATQITSPRAVATRVAPAARPVAFSAVAPQIASRPADVTPQRFGSFVPRTNGQPVTNLRANYSPAIRPVNQTFAARGIQPNASTAIPQLNALASARRERVARALEAIRERRRLRTQNANPAAINSQRRVTTPDPMIQRQPETRDPTQDKAKPNWWNRNDHPSYSDACRRHWHEWHDRGWWDNHCNTIVLISAGYYFLDGSYWYPAYGYDPLNSYYDYDGPVYTYGNLLPDEMIGNVQAALQDAGYYLGPITGSLDVETRAALANFQRDYGLPTTGAIDEPTVETLGLDQSGVYQSGDVSNSY